MSGQSRLLEAIESVYRRRGVDYFRFALARTSDPELSKTAPLGVIQDGREPDDARMARLFGTRVA